VRLFFHMKQYPCALYRHPPVGKGYLLDGILYDVDSAADESQWLEKQKEGWCKTMPEAYDLGQKLIDAPEESLEEKPKRGRPKKAENVD